jgi:hypothetical protein
MANRIGGAMTDQQRAILEAEKSLGETFPDYAGQWVAVRNHAVIEHASSLNGLLTQVDPSQVDRIQHVANEKIKFCIF